MKSKNIPQYGISTGINLYSYFFLFIIGSKYFLETTFWYPIVPRYKQQATTPAPTNNTISSTSISTNIAFKLRKRVEIKKKDFESKFVT